MKFTIIEPELKIKYVPDKDGINSCIEFGKKIARAIKG